MITVKFKGEKLGGKGVVVLPAFVVDTEDMRYETEPGFELQFGWIKWALYVNISWTRKSKAKTVKYDAGV